MTTSPVTTSPVSPAATRAPHLLAAGALLAIAALFGVQAAEASSWSRGGTVATPYGTYTGAVAGACGGGSCSRTAVAAGPYGGTVARSGSVTRTAPGAYSYSRTTVGPYGNSVTRSGSVSRY
ncbi:hypothetical protein [Azorhizobium oxalatiphilum]|uniref:hypothetical protein n=1 Tax=Azorhizobium oxalatiphilum TaxID=980631 RepID=UPI001FCE508C|nr:hypothetical protein [Azorhizobium oxalatiphilum]